MGLGRYAEARAHHAEAALGGARCGVPSILASAWANLGAEALVRRDLVSARLHLGRTMGLIDRLKNEPQTALMVLLDAVSCAASGSPAEAAQQLERATTLLQQAGPAPDAVLRHAHTCVDLARALIDAHRDGPEPARRALAAWSVREDQDEYVADGDVRVLLDLLRQRVAVRAQ